MNRIVRMAGVAAITFISVGPVSAQAPGKPLVEVYKDPTCGCCSKWVDHLREQGFDTKTTEVADITQLKTKNNVPRQARSCHTAVVGGYVIEGHVPAADIQRLLKERPAGVIGLGVPGMPIGSPGMEVPGSRAQPFDVLAFDKAGQTRVFASHGK